MAKIVENAQESQQQTSNVAEDDQVFIAEVTDVYNKVGSGGDVSICRVFVGGKYIFRAVQGPVAIGHKLALRECVREARRSSR